MRFSLVFAASLATASAAIMKAPNAELIEGEYIVVMRPNITTAERELHMAQLGGAKTLFEYTMEGFSGYSVQHTEAAMEKISTHPDVLYVEQNQVARAITEDMTCTQFPINLAGLYGLSRVSGNAIQTNRPLNSFTAARGTPIYIMDTGVYLQHNDFGGRAQHVFDATGEGAGDGNGHGTHCAGTAAGTAYGISKNSPIFDAKCLNRQGSGTFAGVIAAIDYVGRQAGPRVGSLSLGGGFSQAVNDAVNNAVRAGSVMSIASGNSNANACNTSPASAAEGITVNAITNTDARAAYSNFGTCTDIFAPGSNVLSAWIGNTAATNTISGTSMACPHVTGVVAETWAQNPDWTAAQVKALVLSNAASGRVTNPGAGSPDRLAQTSCA